MVRGWFAAAEPTDRDHARYETVICPICARIHLVNPKTASILGEGEDKTGARSRMALRKRPFG
jgi:hypothetical protein